MLSSGGKTGRAIDAALDHILRQRDTIGLAFDFAEELGAKHPRLARDMQKLQSILTGGPEPEPAKPVLAIEKAKPEL